MRTDFTHAKSTFLYQPKAVYERDAQPVSVEASVIKSSVRPASHKHTSDKLNVL